jgi:hypothetical protein
VSVLLDTQTVRCDCGRSRVWHNAGRPGNWTGFCAWEDLSTFASCENNDCPSSFQGWVLYGSKQKVGWRGAKDLPLELGLHSNPIFMDVTDAG